MPLRVAAIAARGLEPDEQLTYSGGMRKVVYRDPDGNEVGFRRRVGGDRQVAGRGKRAPLCPEAAGRDPR